MKVFLVLIIISKDIFHISCQYELPIILSLIKDLEIRQCFFVYENNSLNLLSEKKNLSKKISTAYISHEKFTKYIEQTEYGNDGIGIILKGNNLSRIEEMSQKLDLVNQTYKMSKYKWLVFVQNSELIQAEKLKVPYNCQFVIIQPKTASSYKLSEYYATKDRSFVHDFGTWDYNDGLKTTNISFYWRRLNLNGTRMRILDNKDNEKTCLCCPFVPDCQTAILIKDFSYMMNFERSIIPLPQDILNEGWSWPKYSANVVNIPQALSHKHVHELHNFKIGPIFKLVQNWHIKYPRSVLRSDYFIRPFHKDLWLAVIFSVLVGTMFVIIINKLKTGKKVSIIENMFLILERFCNQGSNDQIPNIYLRIVCMLSQIIAIFITASFGAVIASFVAVETLKIPFTNTQEFIQNGQYKLMLVRNSFLHMYFKETYGSVIKNKFEDYMHYMNEEQVLIEMYKLACINERLVVPSLNRELEAVIIHFKPLIEPHCNIYRISKPIAVFQIILPLEKFCPFMDVFNHNLLRFYERGIQNKMQQITDNRPIATEKMKDDFQSVELKQLTLLLTIPFLGIFLAVLMIIMEFIYKSGSQRQEQKRRRC